MQDLSHKSQKKVVVMGTGGTIAGTAVNPGDNIGYTAAQLGVGQLLADIPMLARLPCKLVAEQVAQIDSKDMGFLEWQKLLALTAHWLGQADVQGVVITHGTDTLEETAFFLQVALHRDLLARKPVVLTCAMRPATALNPDGPQNLRDALAVALTDQASGVTMVCAGTVHGALDVQKSHTYRPDAFSSGDAGPVGYVEEGVVRQLKPWPIAPDTILNSANKASNTHSVLHLILRNPKWPRVEILMSHVGASGWMVEALLAQAVSGGIAPLRGIIVAGTGNGSLHHDLEAALVRAVRSGIVVRRTTRCANGRVLPAANQAIPDTQGLSSVKARIALMLELMRP